MLMVTVADSCWLRSQMMLMFAAAVDYVRLLFSNVLGYHFPVGYYCHDIPYCILCYCSLIADEPQ